MNISVYVVRILNEATGELRGHITRSRDRAQRTAREATTTPHTRATVLGYSLRGDPNAVAMGMATVTQIGDAVEGMTSDLPCKIDRHYVSRFSRGRTRNTPASQREPLS